MDTKTPTTIIAIANQKGGTAKTTTAEAFGVLMAKAGVRAHLIDMDPQASLTSAFGLADAEGRLYTAMSERGTLPIIEVAENLTITPSSIDLSRGETQFMAETGRSRAATGSRSFRSIVLSSSCGSTIASPATVLQTCLRKTDLPENTTIILDCPPSLGVLSINCLTAASHICVVVQPGGFELRTLVHLNETVRLLQERINPKLQVAGAVITNCHKRRSITEQVVQEVAGHYRVLGEVRAEARILYATTSGKVYHLNRSKALDDYGRATEQLWLATRG